MLNLSFENSDHIVTLITIRLNLSSTLNDQVWGVIAEAEELLRFECTRYLEFKSIFCLLNLIGSYDQCASILSVSDFLSAG